MDSCPSIETESIKNGETAAGINNKSNTSLGEHFFFCSVKFPTLELAVTPEVTV